MFPQYKHLFLFLLTTVATYSAQNCTWIHGSSTLNLPPQHGSAGVTLPSNTPGGRSSTVSWFDAATGTLWVFGGSRNIPGPTAALHQDLWKFNTQTNQWTWVKGSNALHIPGNYGTQGVAAASNQPGARTMAVGWRDQTGNLWLFGGYGYGSNSSLGSLNDLWKYDIQNNTWTWMSGSTSPGDPGNYGTIGIPASSNLPRARQQASGGLDPSGKLCLFGGFYQFGNVGGSLNDMWTYDIPTNSWTWIKGANTMNQFGIYGTLGVPHPNNTPGSKSAACAWMDLSGKFWLYGGIGFNADTAGYLSDLWNFDFSTNEWTWVNGSDTAVFQTGSYGILGLPTPANHPGARAWSVSWTDNTGELWLFGGQSQTPFFLSSSHMNDLWKYNINSNQFTWMKGNNLAWQAGVYGTQLQSGLLNNPGGRMYATGWKSSSGELYLLGGSGLALSPNTIGDLDDIWKLNICSSSPFTLTCSKDTICAGENAILSIAGANTWTWTTLQTIPSITVSPSVSTTYSVSGFNLSGCHDTAAVRIEVIPNTLQINSSHSIICQGQTAYLMATGCNTYTWQTLSNNPVIPVSPQISSGYTVSGTSLSGCTFSSTYIQLVNPSPAILLYSNKAVLCEGESATLTALGAVSYSWSYGTGHTNYTLAVSPSVTTVYQVNGSNEYGCSTVASFVQLVDPCLALKNQDTKPDLLKFFPNPSQGQLHLTYTGAEEELQLIVSDATGQVVFEKKLHGFPARIDLNLSTGIYQATLFTNKKLILYCEKLLIE